MDTMKKIIYLNMTSPRSLTKPPCISAVTTPKLEFEPLGKPHSQVHQCLQAHASAVDSMSPHRLTQLCQNA